MYFCPRSLQNRQLEKYEESVLEQQFQRVENLQIWKSKTKSLAEQAQATKKSEESKFGEGRIGLSDLIEADNLSLELERDFQLVDLEMVLSCLEIEKLQGSALVGCVAP